MRGGRPKPRAISRRLTARNEHDHGRIPLRRQPLGHGEAVDTGKLHVYQHDLRPHPLDRRDRLSAVGCLGDDREALGLQQRSRGLPKLGVIIDNQHGRAHRPIVPMRVPGRIGASRNPARRPQGRSVKAQRLARFPESDIGDPLFGLCPECKAWWASVSRLKRAPVSPSLTRPHSANGTTPMALGWARSGGCSGS
jgi:hypothetical protein